MSMAVRCLSILDALPGVLPANKYVQSLSIHLNHRGEQLSADLRMTIEFAKILECEIGGVPRVGIYAVSDFLAQPIR
jgi:hypothetical protein